MEFEEESNVDSSLRFSINQTPKGKSFILITTVSARCLDIIMKGEKEEKIKFRSYN